ncbi:MAG: adenylate kinase [Ilumatobacter sp.]
MQRVAIVGVSGSGKTTLGSQLAECLEVDAIDLDALFHGPNWEPTPTPEFRARVSDRLAQATDGWVVAGNYTPVLDIVHGQADTVVWLDLPRWQSTARVVKRSVGRVIRRERLWNDNRESVRNLVSRDPERNVIRWAWVSHPVVSARYESFATDGGFWSSLDVQRLRRSKEVRDFLHAACD